MWRKPDFRIGREGDWYMDRWYIIPRNRWFNIYLHHLMRDDDPTALHDHPWWNISIVLKGGYYEVMPANPPTNPAWFEYWASTKPKLPQHYAHWADAEGSVAAAYYQPHAVYAKWRGPGSIIVRRATDAHRLVLPDRTDGWGDPLDDESKHDSWSLFITGPKKREWGFWCPKGWKHFAEFIKVNKDGNEVGAGCGE